MSLQSGTVASLPLQNFLMRSHHVASTFSPEIDGLPRQLRPHGNEALRPAQTKPTTSNIVWPTVLDENFKQVETQANIIQHGV